MSTTDKTSSEILEAAGEVFAEKGFRGATIRDICAKARVNLAAVNYHFRDKEQLYWAVCQHAQQTAEARLPYPVREPGQDPTQALRQMLHVHMERMVAHGRQSWHGRLMMRELADPSPMLDRIVADHVRPIRDMFRQAVADLLPAGVAEADLERCVDSVVAQCVFHVFAMPVMSRLRPERTYDAAEIEALTDHILRFSLHGLSDFAQAQRKP